MAKKMSPLYGKYNVVSLNGKAAFHDSTVEFSAGDGNSVRVHAKVANTMNGSLQDDNGVLKGLLMSTMMWGGDEAMALEDAFGQGFDHGFAYAKDGNTLTLTSDVNKIVLQSA